MFSNKGFRLAGGLVIVCALLLAGTAVARSQVSDPDLVKRVTISGTRHTLDDEFTQLRYVKTTDYGVTWTALTVAGDLSTFNPTTGGLPDFGAVTMTNNELCWAVFLADAATPGVYALPGPTFAPHLVMAQGTNDFALAGGTGWVQIGKTPNGDLFVMIWGYTAASAVTFWGVKSTDNGVTWGTPFVVAQEPTIDHTAEYLHMADLNHAQWVFFVYQDQTATNRAIKAGRFPTAGGAGTIVPLNATSGTDVSFYTGNCKPIACDPTAGTPPVYIVFRGNPTSAGTGVYYSGNLGVSFTGSIAIPGAQRYPNTAMQAAAATPWVFSNVGVPASGAYHWAWYSYDELGYNGGSWTAVDTLAVAPGPYDGVRPLLYQNQGHWWDAQRGVASENLWGQFTPEGLYTNYTTNGGSTWIGFSRRWHFQDDQIDAGTTSNCEIVGGTNGVAYVITCGMTGVTDVTAPIIGEQRLLGATNPPGLGPYVVSCAIVENSGIGLSGATIYWTHPQVDSGDYNDAGADSAQLSDPNTGSGTYFFTIPATHSNGDPVVQGDSIFFYCEFTDDYLNTSSHPEQIIIAGVAYLGVSDRVAGPVSGFALNANYPNPFNPTTTLSFDLPANYRATLKVYNALGQQVATLMNGETLSAGHHIVTFDGSILSSGVYICRLTAGPYTAARKMVLMK